MTANMAIHVYTGLGASVDSGAIDAQGFMLWGCDRLWDGTDEYKECPVYPGEASYEKWLKLQVEIAPDNAINNVYYWMVPRIETFFDEVLGEDVTVNFMLSVFHGTANRGYTPTNNNSRVALSLFDNNDLTPDPSPWHLEDNEDAPLVNYQDATKYLVLQLVTPTVIPRGVTGYNKFADFHYQYEEY